VNESLTLALQMQSRQDGNMALEQCIDLERDSLDRLNATMFLVAEMNLRSPEKTDALTYMSAVMTNEDTCQDGINEVGGWQGSDKLTGAIHHQIAELLDISLSFTNSLATSELDAGHHRRLLQNFEGQQAD
jgi:pectinesterase inhibitor-like protein